MIGWCFYIRVGYEYVAWNGTGTMNNCNVYNTCTNPRPWLVDVSSIWVGNGGVCATAWTVWGVCFRSNPFLTWSCQNNFYYSGRMNAAIYGPCTKHP